MIYMCLRISPNTLSDDKCLLTPQKMKPGVFLWFILDGKKKRQRHIDYLGPERTEKHKQMYVSQNESKF
jgi:hypothetical protein